MNVLSEVDQRAAYIDGFRNGTLVKQGYVGISRYAINPQDFSLGSYQQQSMQGYVDAVKGFPVNFIPWRIS